MIQDFRFSGLENGDTAVFGQDFTVTGTFETPDAGTGKTITYTVNWINEELAAKYNFTPVTKQNGIINKATLSLSEGQVNLYYGQTLGEATLSGFVPSPAITGTFSWNGVMGDYTDYRPLVSDEYFYSVYLVFTPEDPNYHVKTQWVWDNQINILPVTPVMGEGAGLSAAEIKAGAPLSDSHLAFEGIMQNPYYPEIGAVAGSWSWKDGDQTVTESGPYTAVFTPEDLEHYLPVEIRVQVDLVHTHDYGTEWKSDHTNHWHECDCGERADEAPHSFTWIVDKEATETEPGSKHEECEICGYAKTAVEIPATGGIEPTEPTDPATPTKPEPPEKPDNPENPSATEGSKDTPITGDSSNPALAVLALLLSGVGLVGIWAYRRKEEQTESSVKQ